MRAPPCSTPCCAPQPGGYAACFTAGDEQVLSVSPELFFDWQASAAGGSILARPMKGTAARGAAPALDAAAAERLRASPKERAENVMIVDLLRNDLSRIAEPHTVRVPELFHTQALPTVWQMTSDVQARTPQRPAAARCVRCLVPVRFSDRCAQGAGDAAIRELERQPRGIICGAIGVVRPDGHGGIAATFNAPIRTVVTRGTRPAAASAAVSPQAQRRVPSGKNGCTSRLFWRGRANRSRRRKPWRWSMVSIAIRQSTWPAWLRRRSTSDTPWQPAALHAAPAGTGRAAWQRPVARAPVAGPLWPATRRSLRLATHGHPGAMAPGLPGPWPRRMAKWVRFENHPASHYAAFAPAPGSGIF